MSTEFDAYLDFWLECQKQGFAGNLPRIKLPNGSKMVAFHEHPLLYVDNWYGADLGGGQTILYVLSELWKPDNPLQISGTPVARLGYSGKIVRRLDSSYDMGLLRRVLQEKGLENLPQSELVWTVLKLALSQVTRERPLRGPERYEWHRDNPEIEYTSKEQVWDDMMRTVGEEAITYQGKNIFLGNYDFILIKKNLEDRVPVPKV